MSLENDVKEALIGAGAQLKDDLWTEQDKELLAQRARDLAHLQAEASKATDIAKRDQYKLAAKLVVQQVELLALTRMNVTEKHLRETFGKFLRGALVPTLVKLLPLLFSL